MRNNKRPNSLPGFCRTFLPVPVLFCPILSVPFSGRSTRRLGNVLFFKVGLVGATGIEPVTPTVSRLTSLPVRHWKDGLNWLGLRDMPGFCRVVVA